MDQLASCYFCGGALDVSLSEYPVVPRDLRADGDENKTVVLCGTCRKKLGKIVENVVAAASEPAAGRSFEGTGFEPDERSETVTADPLFDERNDEPMTNDRGDTGGPAAPTAGDEAGPESDDSATQSEPATAASEATPKTESANQSDQPPAEPGATAGSTADTSEAESDERQRDKAGSNDDGPTMTRLEYNKVMRLLKNREFPVDRMEIRDVATSAYQISPEEFDAVVEAAIERDLLAEEDGQFVDPS